MTMVEAPPLLAWLETQIDTDEQTGRAASGHHESEHWRWECWHDGWAPRG